jgi:RNA polymerase sigma-70 factor (ECF subfamily)
VDTFPQGSKTQLTGKAEALDEPTLVDALLEGDELAFVRLLDSYHGSMLRLAMLYVRDQSVAEEVVQETWVGVLHGLRRFERRSSLKTWIFRILTNQAKTRGKRESLSVPFSVIWDVDVDITEPSLDPTRSSSFLRRLRTLRASDDPNWPQHWALPPHSWDSIPEDRLLSKETRAYIDRAIETLPGNQRAIVRLRDVDGWTAEEVCNVLGITDTNQRVLLHRARSRLRQCLEEYLNVD